MIIIVRDAFELLDGLSWILSRATECFRRLRTSERAAFLIGFASMTLTLYCHSQQDDETDRIHLLNLLFLFSQGYDYGLR